MTPNALARYPQDHPRLDEALAGAGAFGVKHLDAIQLIDGVGSSRWSAASSTRPRRRRRATASATSPPRNSPTAWRAPGRRRGHPVHADADARRAGLACLRCAGKHVQVEIPLADSLRDAEAVVALQKRTGWSRCAATRRFNPSHQWVHRKIAAGEFNIQQMDVQTYFFRRTNMNALGQPRSWTDHLLWHHAAHRGPVRLPVRRADRAPRTRSGPDPPGARHRDGHVDPAQGRERRDLHAELSSTTTGRWAPSSATSATRHLHRALRRPGHRQGREDRRVAGRGVDERHRAAGPRVLQPRLRTPPPETAQTSAHRARSPRQAWRPTRHRGAAAGPLPARN